MLACSGFIVALAAIPYDMRPRLMFLSTLISGPVTRTCIIVLLPSWQHQKTSSKFGVCFSRLVSMLIGRSKSRNPAALLWPAALVVWGPGSASSLHRHHCVQLVLALRETLRVRERSNQRWTTCAGVLIRPDASHEVDATNTVVLIAFVDAESELGTALLDRVAGPVTTFSLVDVAGWRAMLGSPTTLDSTRVEPWLRTELLHSASSPRLDPRVKRTIRMLRDQLAELN